MTNVIKRESPKVQKSEVQKYFESESLTQETEMQKSRIKKWLCTLAPSDFSTLLAWLQCSELFLEITGFHFKFAGERFKLVKEDVYFDS